MLRAELLFGLLRSFLISLAIQGTTLGRLCRARTRAGAAYRHRLARRGLVHRDAGGEPSVSFGGWGLRELSAVVALQAIGLSAASALLIGLADRFSFIAVIAGTAVFIMLGRDAARRGRSRLSNRLSATPAPDYTAALDWSLPLMAATAVFFQIYIPTGEGQISVNLADPGRHARRGSVWAASFRQGLAGLAYRRIPAFGRGRLGGHPVSVVFAAGCRSAGPTGRSSTRGWAGWCCFVTARPAR